MGSGQFDKAGILAADFSGLEAGSPGFEVRTSDRPNLRKNVRYLMNFSFPKMTSTPWLLLSPPPTMPSPTVSPSVARNSSPSRLTSAVCTARRYELLNALVLEKKTPHKYHWERRGFITNSQQGKTGAIVVRATACTMIAHHGEGAQTTNAATVVENLVDYINNPQ